MRALSHVERNAGCLSGSTAVYNGDEVLGGQTS